MISVTGYIDGVSYTAVLGEGQDSGIGVVSGSPRAIALISGQEGLPIDVTPTGPTVPGGTGTVQGALAILATQTQVSTMQAEDGEDLEELLGGRSLPGVAY